MIFLAAIAALALAGKKEEERRAAKAKADIAAQQAAIDLLKNPGKLVDAGAKVADQAATGLVNIPQIVIGTGAVAAGAETLAVKESIGLQTTAGITGETVRGGWKAFTDGVNGLTPESDAERQYRYEMEQAKLAEKARADAYGNAVNAENLSWQLGVERATQQAAEAEKAATLGYRGVANQTYLQNLQAQAGIQDMDQQAQTELGNIRSAQALTGTKRNDKYLDIINEQMADKLNFAKSSLVRSTEGSLTAAGANRDMAFESAAAIRKSYAEGGTQYSIYQNRLAGMKSAFDNNQAMSGHTYDYLEEMRLKKGYDFFSKDGKVNLAGFFNVGSRAFDAYGQVVGLASQALSYMPK